MHMMVKKRHCKLVALFLLLVLLVPFVPLVSVSADPLPVQVPDFPYGVNAYHSTNTGSFALWQVHGSNHVSYVQTYSSVFGDGFAFPVVLRSGLGGLFGYYYYINYEKIIDTWDIYGNHTDGFPSTQNIRIPAPNETTVDSDVYATLVYCTTDIYYGNGYGDDDVYAYQNFIVPSYADPTPTPVPVVPNVIIMYGDYMPFQLGAIPGYGDDVYANGFEATGEVINIANALPDHQPTYSSIFAGIDYDYYHKPYFGIFITDSNTMDNPFVNAGVVMEHNIYGPYTSVDGTVTKYVHYFIRDGGLDWSVYGKPNLTNINIPEYHWEDYGLNKVNQAYYPYLAGYGYCDFYGFNGQSNPNVSPTPTPTSAPTAIPQPSISPTPTDPPETGDDNNYTGLFGWLKRIRDAILNIPKKIVTGILNALKYIFIPDINKVKEVYNTFNNMFGVARPSEFVPDPNQLFRPDNVVWKFHPISLNGEETETTDITLIDFEKVDKWLDSSPGMVITHLLKAIFGITMFAYLVYIFTKHIATINYTDAKTIKDLDTSSQKGGNDND